MTQLTPEPVLDERGVEAAGVAIQNAKPLPLSVSGLDWYKSIAAQAITAYQLATGDALTEALRERDRALSQRDENDGRAHLGANYHKATGPQAENENG